MPTQVTQDEVRKVITDGLAELGYERGAIVPDATFEDLDVDSLDLVELAQIVEEELGVELGSADVAELRTVGDAIALVVARAGS